MGNEQPLPSESQSLIDRNSCCCVCYCILYVKYFICRIGRYILLFFCGRKVTARLHSKQRVEAFSVDKLSSILCEQMSKHRLKLTMETRNKTSNESRTLPLIVPCLVRTRFGKDLEIALGDERVSNKDIILRIHYQEEHALPVVLNNEVFKQHETGEECHIIDLAFIPAKGFYDCEMNRTGWKNLAVFLNKFHKE